MSALYDGSCATDFSFPFEKIPDDNLKLILKYAIDRLKDYSCILFCNKRLYEFMREHMSPKPLVITDAERRCLHLLKTLDNFEEFKKTQQLVNQRNKATRRSRRSGISHSNNDTEAHTGVDTILSAVDRNYLDKMMDRLGCLGIQCLKHYNDYQNFGIYYYKLVDVIKSTDDYKNLSHLQQGIIEKLLNHKCKYYKWINMILTLSSEDIKLIKSWVQNDIGGFKKVCDQLRICITKARIRSIGGNRKECLFIYNDDVGNKGGNIATFLQTVEGKKIINFINACTDVVTKNSNGSETKQQKYSELRNRERTTIVEKIVMLMLEATDTDLTHFANNDSLNMMDTDTDDEEENETVEILNDQLVALCNDLIHYGLQPYFTYVLNQYIVNSWKKSLKEEMDEFMLNIYTAVKVTDRLWQYAFHPIIQEMVDNTHNMYLPFNFKVSGISAIKKMAQQRDYKIETIVFNNVIGLAIRPSSFEYYKEVLKKETSFRYLLLEIIKYKIDKFNKNESDDGPFKVCYTINSDAHRLASGNVVLQKSVNQTVFTIQFVLLEASGHRYLQQFALSNDNDKYKDLQPYINQLFKKEDLNGKTLVLNDHEDSSYTIEFMKIPHLYTILDGGGLYAQLGRNVLPRWTLPIPFTLATGIILRSSVNGETLMRGTNMVEAMAPNYVSHIGRPKPPLINDAAACMFHVVMTPMSNNHLVFMCKVMFKYGGKKMYKQYIDHLRECHKINTFIVESRSLEENGALKINGGDAVKLALISPFLTSPFFNETCACCGLSLPDRSKLSDAERDFIRMREMVNHEFAVTCQTMNANRFKDGVPYAAKSQCFLVDLIRCMESNKAIKPYQLRGTVELSQQLYRIKTNSEKYYLDNMTAKTATDGEGLEMQHVSSNKEYDMSNNAGGIGDRAMRAAKCNKAQMVQRDRRASTNNRRSQLSITSQWIVDKKKEVKLLAWTNYLYNDICKKYPDAKSRIHTCCGTCIYGSCKYAGKDVSHLQTKETFIKNYKIEDKSIAGILRLKDNLTNDLPTFKPWMMDPHCDVYECIKPTLSRSELPSQQVLKDTLIAKIQATIPSLPMNEQAPNSRKFKIKEIHYGDNKVYTFKNQLCLHVVYSKQIIRIDWGSMKYRMEFKMDHVTVIGPSIPDGTPKEDETCCHNECHIQLDFELNKVVHSLKSKTVPDCQIQELKSVNSFIAIIKKGGDSRDIMKTFKRGRLYMKYVNEQSNNKILDDDVEYNLQALKIEQKKYNFGSEEKIIEAQNITKRYLQSIALPSYEGNYLQACCTCLKPTYLNRDGNCVSFDNPDEDHFICPNADEFGTLAVEDNDKISAME